MATTAATPNQDSNTEPLKRPAKKSLNPVVAFLNRLLEKFTGFTGWDYVFKGFMIFFAIYTVYSYSLLREFQTSPKYAHIEKYQLSDFKIAFAVAMFFIGFKKVTELLFLDWLRRDLNLEKFKTEEEKERRVSNVCRWLANIIYYSFTTVVMFFLFRDQYFWSPWLGGTGEFKGPYYHHPHKQNIPYAVEFYMFQYGYHIHTLVDYVIHKRKEPKFWEMFLHHFLTLSLMFFSYLVNHTSGGIVTLFLHDPCDIFLCLGRAVGEFKSKPRWLEYLSGALLFFTWGFFRLVLLPIFMVYPTYEYVWTTNESLYRWITLYLGLMLTLLFFMSFYWFIFLIRVVVNIVTRSKNYNIFDNANNKKKL